MPEMTSPRLREATVLRDLQLAADGLLKRVHGVATPFARAAPLEVAGRRRALDVEVVPVPWPPEDGPERTVKQGGSP